MFCWSCPNSISSLRCFKLTASFHLVLMLTCGTQPACTYAWSWNNVVSIVNRLCTGHSGIHFTWGRVFSLIQNVLTSCGANPACCWMGSRGSFHRGKVEYETMQLSPSSAVHKHWVELPLYCSPSPDIVTCGLYGSGIKSKWEQDFLHPSRLALVAYPTSCMVGTTSLSWWLHGQGMALTTHCQLVLRLRKSAGIPVFHLWGCMSCSVVTFTFHVFLFCHLCTFVPWCVIIATTSCLLYAVLWFHYFSLYSWVI